MRILRLPIALSALTLMVGACGSNDSGTSGAGTDAGSDATSPPATTDAGHDATTSSDSGIVDAGASDSGTPPAKTYAVGGTASGVAGTGLVLQINGGDDLPIAKDGTFAFTKELASGSPYAVTVKTQPSAPKQVCTVTGGTGTVANGDVSSIAVNCTTDQYTVGGTVSGLSGAGLILQDNAGDDLVVNANGTFAFATSLKPGAAYAVTVKAQPSTPSQTCTVTSGSGTMADANVTAVAVSCTTNKYTISATVSGLHGTGLVLKDNAGDALAVSADGKATFATSIESGATYAVTVDAQPSGPTQTCTVSGGTGTVGAADVTSVAVNCTTDKFAIGGTATGVLGSGAVLTNNGGDDLAISASGTFSFATLIDSGAAYSVAVKTQPSSPSQTCTLNHEAGTVGAAAVTDVTLSCVTNAFKVGGSVTGVIGTGLVLQDNGGDDIPVAADGTFTFPTSVLSGTTYAVTVKNQPTGPSQTCKVTSGTGTIGGSDVTNVAVACTTDSFTVGGSVAGLTGTGLVLRDNGGDDLPVSADGSFTFATKVLSGAAYAITVKTQPTGPSQTCTVSAGSGTVTNGNVVTAMVNCSTNKYAVGGSVTNLAGTGLVLQNNAGDNLTINGNGPFSFATPISSGAAYAVTVKTQPTVPSQTCTVTNGAGNVGGAAVTNVSVNCVTNKYTIGGNVTGVTGGTIVLKDNGVDDLTLSADGAFTFVTSISSGSAYAVTVGTPPAGKSCTITNGTGTVGAANVTNVAIACSPAVDYGPNHTFAGMTTNHYITQGCCSVGCAGNAATDAQYFCTHFYGNRLGKTCTPLAGYSIASTPTPTTPKMHKNGGCTSNGSDIPSTTCDPNGASSACKIGNWSETTSGLVNLVCHCQ